MLHPLPCGNQSSINDRVVTPRSQDLVTLREQAFHVIAANRRFSSTTQQCSAKRRQCCARSHTTSPQLHCFVSWHQSAIWGELPHIGIGHASPRRAEVKDTLSF